MPTINFVNPNAAMGDALREYMIEREAERQRHLQEQRTAQLDADDRAERQRTTERQRISDQRQQQVQQQQDADRLAGIVGPDGDLSDPAADRLQQGGYSITERQTLPARTIDPASIPGVMPGRAQPNAGPQKVPGFVTMPQSSYKRRGETFTEQQARKVREDATAERDEERAFRWDSARETEHSRADQAQLTRDAATERANADRDTRELIARLSQSGNAETRALANELKRMQIDTAQDKLDTARTDREHAASSARESTQTALDSVSKLLKHPGMGAATGAYEVRGWTQDAVNFNAERDQLVAALTLPNLGALKGPMSDRDVIFVKQLATKLANTRMSEAETRSELARVRLFLESKMGAQQSVQSGPAVGTRRTINGQPAEWDGRGWLSVGR